jgi:acylglycerol lipase
MHHLEGYFQGPRQAKIYYQGWLPPGDARAVLLLVHGLGEHSGRYQNVAQFFVPLGYAVYAFDHIGHGKSEGQREYVDRYEEYTSTLDQYYQKVRKWQAGKPIYLVGHSLGGLIAVSYLLESQNGLAGAILSAPSLAPPDGISPTTLAAARVLSRIAPRMGVQKLDSTGISRDPEVVKAYDEDPLVFHGKTPARMAAEGLRMIDDVRRSMHRITLPVLALHGAEDKMINPVCSQSLYELAGSEDKTLRQYPGLHHEIFNEPEREEVFKEMHAWLEARLEPSNAASSPAAAG